MNSVSLMEIYQVLLDYFGPRGWWPGESRQEIIIGAVLTQAVSWKNVEKAIVNLKQAGVLDFEVLANLEDARLAELIRPALYHRQKAKKLKLLTSFIIEQFGGNLDLMFKQPADILRPQLLAVWGIGPETADSILLYAGNQLVFVVDAYTKRIFARLGLVDEDISYYQLQNFIQGQVIPQVEIYNEFHALLVALGARICKKTAPLCEKCPISNFCKYSA